MFKNRHNMRRFGIVATLGTLATGAHAAVPAAVTDAITGAGTDAGVIAAAVLVVVVGLLAFKYMRGQAK